MVLSRRVVRGLVFFIILAALPLFARSRGDTGSSQNGLFGSCPPKGGGNICPYLNAQGTAVLTGIDTSGNPVTVTITLYDWGYYPCSLTKKCPKNPKPLINYSVLDVVLTGITPAGIESLVIKGVLPNPTYVSCGPDPSPGVLACIAGPEPDSNSDVQEPTPITAADAATNTRWDFGGAPPLNPALPAIPFDQLGCLSDGNDDICTGSPLGEAVLVVGNSVASNKLGTAASDYLVTLIDGTQLGALSVPKAPTKQVANTNNTQATETVITGHRFKDYTDSSQAYPQINADGSEQYPGGFTPLPLNNPPPCNPPNAVNGQTDTRTFRTAWYSYTATADGSVTIKTAGSRYDTLVYVFTGDASQPAVVSCDDDPAGGHTLQAYTAFNVTQGTNYQIVVGETPTFQTNTPGTLTGYPLSVDGTLYFALQFSTKPVITTTTVTSSLNPSIFGQSVQFSATVISNGFGTPLGTITFIDDSTILGVSPLSDGKATFSAVPLAVGANLITASFSGDFGASKGAMNQVVNQAGTTLALSSNQNPSGLGQPVTFTAAITPQYSGQASGTVTFYNGATTLGAATVSSNSASLTTAALAFGTNSITAIYSGDSNFTGSTSKALLQVVENPSATTVASSPNPSTIGNPVTFTVAVTSAAGTPAGTVEILNGANYLTTLTLNSGSAQYTTTQMPYGTDIVTAVYSGGGNIAGSTSAPVNQVVVLPANFSILHSFAGGTDGDYPAAGLVQDAQGNLYGTTEAGGDGACDKGNSCGTVFMVPATGTETVLYSFTGAGGDGAFPIAGLVRDAQGDLYGTTAGGGQDSCPGSYGCGTVFKVTATGTETVLYSFTGAGGDGESPNAGLVLDAQGNLYGTTEYGGDGACGYGSGCGTVFELSPNGSGGWNETVLYSFTGAGGDGAFPNTGLVLDAQGNLYGTTEAGGGGVCANGNACGTVFQVTTTGQEAVLYSFTGAGGDGGNPYAGLVRDAQGNLYGTTGYYGEDGYGTVFQVTTTGQETVLYSFTGAGGDGKNPYAGLVLDTQGNLYGTTNGGGAGNAGTVFEVTAPGKETVLFSWMLGDGAGPNGLVRDAQGNLYGTTSLGGDVACANGHGCGTVFRLAP
jgi:uncharacterized repeat protein (TIGR03803 family)